MKCPVCGAWTSVKETRTRKTDGVVTRRYECGNLHRFSTEERIKYDEKLYQSGKDWAANGRSRPPAAEHLAWPTQEAGVLGADGRDWPDSVANAGLLGLASVEQGAVAE